METIIIAIAAFIGVAALVIGVAFMFRPADGGAVEDRLDILTGAGAAAEKGKKEASLLASPLEQPSGMLEGIAARFNLSQWLEQADIPIGAPKFLLMCVGLGIVGTLIGMVAPMPKAFAPLAGIVLGFVPLGYAWFARKRRLSQFAKQLPDALELVARALRAGHSLAAGFRLVAEEMSAPISKEFGRVYESQNLGIPMADGLEEMTERVPNLDLRFFATAVILQRQTGGDLAEILDKIGHLIRERFKIFGQVQALTGEGRLSGVVLLGLPPVLFIVMYRMNPDYVMLLFTDPMGKQMLAVAVVLQVIGALVIQKIVNIKV